MVSTKTVTVIVMLVAIAVLIVWDIFVAGNNIPGDTISEITLNYARSHPIIPFALGVLCGHLFWSQN